MKILQALKILFSKNNIACPENFRRVYEFKTRLHHQQLHDYYVSEEVKKADDYWKKQEYDKAKKIYEKYFDDLSNVQRMRLQIGKNKSV